MDITRHQTTLQKFATAICHIFALLVPSSGMLPERSSALDAALARIGAAERPDTPDLHITAVRRLPAQAAEYAAFPARLDPRLTSALRSRGIHQLYTHQADAIDHALAGRNVVVTTPTASGKTLCYNAPVLDAILQDPSSRALYLFPTKALAQDQLAELQAMCEVIERGVDCSTRIGVFTYDGDTPQDARRTIRGRAQVVLSNADMLHSGILPHHPRWAKLFENLRYVVIDELHAYRGVFGSHVANVLRRLRRVCRHYGSDPVFLCSSATIANPRELAERLTAQAFELVERSGAPRGEKFFVFVNPPVVNHQLGIRRSYLGETRRVAAEFLKRHLQVIVFAQSRLSTEILTTYLKEDFRASDAASIRGYRGGYLPNRRRDIERGLREGAVRAVVSTNALELGIDIGALDVAVLAGYPGTIAATWQRAGRAGRRSGRSAAVMVASSAPLDQFVVRNPAYFFDASPERALIDPDNLHILVDHVKCAAFELPFTATEQFCSHGLAGGAAPRDVARHLLDTSAITDGAALDHVDAPAHGEPPDVQEILGVLGEQALVHRSGDDADAQWTWTNESYPADAVSLRSVSSDNFVIVDMTGDARIIGETDFTSGPATLHSKAIYIVEGQLYQVERLDFDARKAFVREVDCDYYTDAITYSKVTPIDVFVADGLRAHGEVHVVTRVVGFKKIKFYTNENVGSGELDLPEQQMHTTAYWLTIPATVMGMLPYAADDRRDGVVGLAYAMRQVAQLLLMCDAHDIGISIDSDHAIDRDPPEDGPSALHPVRVFVYDNYPGGIGFSAPLFQMHDELLARTRQLIADCDCPHGCPGCVGPIGDIGPLGKQAALRILDLLPSVAVVEKTA